MKKFVFTWRHVSVFLLVSLLVGLSCAPSSAFASSEVDVSSVTNRYFLDYDDCVDFARAEVREIDSMTNRITGITDHLVSIEDSYFETQSQLSQLKHYLEQEGRVPSQEYDYAFNALAALQDFSPWAYADALEDTRGQLVSFRTSLVRGGDIPTYQIVVEEGSGCGCPDYTGVLEGISNSVSVISRRVADLEENIDTYLINSVWNFLYNVEDALGNSDAYEDYSHGEYLGKYLGYALSNSWDSVYYLNLYSGLGNGVFDVNGVSTGPKFLQEMWNYILRPFAQTWADHEWDEDNRMIHGFRDFYIGDHVVAVTNEASNPVWVEFTNSVSLSASTLAALTNKLFSLEQLMDSLTNASFKVIIDDESFERQQEVEKEQTQRAADQAELENSDPDMDTVDLPSSDVSGVNGLKEAVTDVFKSYRDMFQAIPNELPEDIMIHKGWVIRNPTISGSLSASSNDHEVPSIHWRPGDYTGLSRLLGGIRGCFTALWLVFYVIVIWASMAIDLFAAGVCLYCVYGLLLGKPEVTLKGIRYMFGVLCSLLGRNPS